MPKIVINEYDLTTAGGGEYANFSVVVPGYLSEKADESVFDENGIYECSSQTEFVNKIGKRAAEIITRTTAVEAIAPIIAMSIKYDPTVEDNMVEKDPTTGKVLSVTFKTEEAYTNAFNALREGKATFETNIAGVAGEESVTTDIGAKYFTCAAIANTNTEIGEFVDEDYIYTALDLSDEALVDYAKLPYHDGDTSVVFDPIYTPAYTEYFIINDDVYTEGEADIPYAGRDGKYVEDRITHYGNQIAYELLGLGYTVLYKKMTEYTPTEIQELAAAEDGKNVETGEDGIGVIKANKSAAVNELGDLNFWECLKDKSTYDFRYIVTGLLTNNDGANKAIKGVAEPHDPKMVPFDDVDPTAHGRGDCIALIDLDCTAYAGKTQKAAIPCIAQEASEFASAYAAVFAPYVEYIMSEDEAYNNNCVFPGSFHYLACAANSSSKNYAEWYANAGLSRGVAKYTVKTTGCKLGEIAIQALEPRFVLPIDKDANGEVINTTVAVNLIVNIKGSYYLWGNRTAKKLGERGSSEGDLTSSNFLNVRQLCSTIKKQVYVTCRRLTFDPNSNMLWINFRSLIKPTLEKMKADQGIKDYKFVKNETDRKAFLSAKIRIVPIEAVEDFEIGLYLEDSLEDVVITEA